MSEREKAIEDLHDAISVSAVHLNNCGKMNEAVHLLAMWNTVKSAIENHYGISDAGNYWKVQWQRLRKSELALFTRLNTLRDRLRKTCQILVEAVGADGPCDADQAAERAASQLTTLRAENERLRAESVEHEDDGEPVTKEWMDETFRVWRSGNRRGWELRATVIVREVDDGMVPVFSHTGEGCCGALLKTRGDVRRLCKVLGIQLKECD